MNISFVFGFIMMCILLFFGLGYFGVFAYGYWGSGTLLFILLALLGWKTFGPPIKS